MDRHKAVRQAKRTFRPSIGNDILLNIAATAWGIGYSWLHNYGESIPIFRSKDYKKGDPRLRDTLNETFELSVDALLDGKSLLIMPEERAGEPDKNHLWKFQPGAANVAKHYFEREGDLPKLKYVLVGVSFKTGDVSIDNVVLEDFSGDNKSISELKSLLENTIQDMCTEMNYTGIENITYGANLDESFEDKQQKYWDLQSLVIYDLGAEHVESLMAPHELHSIYNVPNKGLTFHIDLKDHVGIRIESEGPMVEDLYDDIIEILIPNYVPPPPQSFFSLL